MAAFCRLLYDCISCGLVTGPKIDAAACDEILAEGSLRGFRPASAEKLIDKFLVQGNRGGG